VWLPAGPKIRALAGKAKHGNQQLLISRHKLGVIPSQRAEMSSNGRPVALHGPARQGASPVELAEIAQRYCQAPCPLSSAEGP
jgi:hypothetical protein